MFGCYPVGIRGGGTKRRAAKVNQKSRCRESWSTFCAGASVKRVLTVVFDLGEVLASMTDQLDIAAAELGVSPPDLEPVYWRHRHPYDEGGSDLEYWSRVAADLGVSLRDGQAEELGLADCRSWTRIRSGAEAVLRELHDAGVPTAVLSNAPAVLARALEEAPWRPLVGRCFVSGVLGVAKPDHRIFDQVAEGLGCTPEALAFVDDKEVNVEAAKAAGWRTHWWRGDAETRAWLVELGVLAG